MHTRTGRRPMDAVTLKAALVRAHVTQAELATRLGRSRGVVAGWIAADRVPEEYVGLVYEALDIETAAPARPLSTYSNYELLAEISRRLEHQASSTEGHGDVTPVPEGGQEVATTHEPNAERDTSLPRKGPRAGWGPLE